MDYEKRELNQDELDFLLRHGFVSLTNDELNCLFKKNGIIYDLSAADIFEIDNIESKGLFIVAEDETP